MSFRAEEILAAFDRTPDEFPMLDNANFFVFSQRLLLMRSTDAWALVFEIGNVNPSAGSVTGSGIVHSKYGSRLQGGVGSTNDDASAAFSNGRGVPIWPEEDREDDPCGGFVDPAANSIVVCGTEVAIAHDARWYASAGIELRTPDRPRLIEFYRAIAAKHPQLVRATEEKRRERLGTDAPVILDLTDWWHPDLARDELPSSSHSIRQIAQVIETGDVRAFDRSAPTNSHWRNWLEQGCNQHRFHERDAR